MIDPKTLAKTKQKAEKSFSKGKYKDALKLYTKIESEGKRDPRIFIRMGDIARKMDDDEVAVENFIKAINIFVKQGFIIKAIAVCKIVINMDPSKEDIQQRLAKLYASQGMTIDEAPAAAPPAAPSPAAPPSPAAAAPTPPVAPPAPAPPAAPAALIDSADDEPLIEMPSGAEPAPPEAAPTPEPAPEPPGQTRAFPRTPLFSEFTRDELIDVVKMVRFSMVEGGTTIFSEGDSGDSIFIVVEGKLDVIGKASDGADVVISKLKQGDFLGEFGFFSGAKRKTTVKATEPVELLELKKSDIDALIEKYPRVSKVLFGFYKERVVDRLMALSEIFRPMSVEDRKEVLKRLTLSTINTGDHLMKEGESGDTMCLLKSGKVEVWIRDETGGKKVLKELCEGDFVGEIALATSKPRTATVTALVDVEAVVFSRPMIKDILGKYPIIKDILLGVIKERISDVGKARDRAKAELL